MKELIKQSFIWKLGGRIKRNLIINREFGYDTSAISRVCLGKQKTSYGYGWKYIDD